MRLARIFVELELVPASPTQRSSRKHMMACGLGTPTAWPMLISYHRSAASGSRTTPWPRRSTASTRPRSIWRQRSRASASAVEFATRRWVDWFNNQQLFGSIGYITPTEAEANHYAAMHHLDMAAGKHDSAHRSGVSAALIDKTTAPCGFRGCAQENARPLRWCYHLCGGAGGEAVENIATLAAQRFECDG